MRPAFVRPSRSRRGVTLLEMLVVVALLLLMMSVLVQIFRSATGAITEQRAYAQMDQSLRRLDTVIRLDLRGVTAKMTPPNNPRDGRGYFELAENALADAQGEDTDDTLRFTAKAPEGQPFTGRIWVASSQPSPPVAGSGYFGAKSLKPVTVTSQFAEIVYFLRNGNLYRRVKLINPDYTPLRFYTFNPATGVVTPQRSGTLAVGNVPFEPFYVPGATPTESPLRFGFATDLFQPLSAFSGTYTGPNGDQGAVVGWNLNDLSARPSPYSRDTNPATGAPFTPAQQPLWSYTPIANTLADLTKRENRIFNPRFADDYQTPPPALGGPPPLIPDGIADDFNNDGVPDFYPTMYPQPAASAFFLITGTGIESLFSNAATAAAADVLAFPFVYPNGYTQPLPTAAPVVGRIHSPDPTNDPHGLCVLPLAGTILSNHAPLAEGDNLPLPASRPTFWGFPTWRETLSTNWTDPIKRLNDPAAATYYSSARTGLPTPDPAYTQSVGLTALANAPNPATANRWWLPPAPAQANEVPNDSDPSQTPAFTAPAFVMPPEAVLEDDLIATGVRSFDIKVFDPDAGLYNQFLPPAQRILRPGYYDLGYFSAYFPNVTATQFDTRFNTPGLLQDQRGNPQGFGHEGRMPPLTTDNRADAQFPGLRTNLGDDRAGVVRLRRVWDSWSTTYTNSPALPNNPLSGPAAGALPAVPSYPAPYTSPLRGIQIQIRIVDPSNRRIKTLTIRQDFADKL